jgi:hypothetical protein
MGVARWALLFEQDGATIGGLGGRSDVNSARGIISRPLIEPDHLHELPSMLAEAAHWAESQGKSAIQVAIPVELESAGVALEEVGWARGYTWVQLVKELSQAV